MYAWPADYQPTYAALRVVGRQQSETADAAEAVETAEVRAGAKASAWLYQTPMLHEVPPALPIPLPCPPLIFPSSPALLAHADVGAATP